MIATLRRTAVLALVTLALLAPAGPVAAATDPDATDMVSFGIAPAGADRPDARPYLAVTAPAGSVVYEHVALVNQDDEPVTLEVYGADVVMADGGGLSVRAAADTDTDAGAWVSVDAAGPVQVPAQTADGFGYTIVPLAITIPQDAEPGDHVAGLVASLVTVAAGADQGPSIRLEQRVAARVYVQVQGEVAPGLVVEDVVADWAPDGVLGTGAVTVGWTVRNTGNVRVAVEPSASVAGPLGVAARRADAPRVEELLPGGTARVEATLEGVPALGREEVTVTAAAVAPLTGRDPGLAPVVATTHVWALAWLPLAVAALVTLLIVVAVARGRSARRAARILPDGPVEPGLVVDTPVGVGR
ncbi:hypothetical protein CSO01_25000 [Cellulomonas soli]|uniref:DUF916 domain-containing protein n=2 Tax=Cellulomonas soli TaxID=931535 RepID=A0A512PF06_9CELL|nr:hypothetical protein [Cellulomonas soli]NYI59423.1 hypothetical protein [Cellulomonas soli]GEP69785.1 hypothetical protein CSO01_25000 [Cellulomonas soli]